MGIVMPVYSDLVAWWPLNDGPAGTTVAGANEVIHAGLTFQDAVVSGSGATWVDDAERGVVYNTTEDSRLQAGTQGIDLSSGGFTWSFWVKTDGNQNADGGADVIIGSRNGVWNKFQVGAYQRWVDIGGYNLDDAVWHHGVIVGTIGPRVSVYIDGAHVGTDTTTYNSIMVVNDKLEFGGSDKYSEDVAGRMSDIGIWSNALKEGEIMALYNLGNNTNLRYNVSQAQQLFDLYNAAGDEYLEIDGSKWYYSQKISDDADTDGQLFEVEGGFFNLIMNSSNDYGLSTVPRFAGLVLILQ